MTAMPRRRIRIAVLALPAALLASGCLLFAGGAAAGSGIYLTTRGAEAVVHGDVEAVAETVRASFEELGIRFQGFREAEDGPGRRIFGATDDGDVTVLLDRRTDNATRVEATVRTSTVTWDKEMAKTIVQEIRQRREG